MKGQFEHIIAEKLRDVSQKTEPADWTRIQRSLGLEAPRRTPLYRYVTAAAAVLLLALGGFYWLRVEPDLPVTGSPIALVDQPAGQTPKPAAQPDAASAAQQTETPQTPKTDALKAVLGVKAAIDRSNGVAAASSGNSLLTARLNDDPQPKTTVGQMTTPAGQPATRTAQDTRSGSNDRNLPSSGENYTVAQAYTPGKPDRSQRNRNRLRSVPNSNWALALFADGSGGGSSSAGDHFGGVDLMSREPSVATKSSVALVGYDYDMKNGLMRIEASQWDHNLPLTFGFSVRKGLGRDLGVEIGLTYSYLSSKAEISEVKAKQQLHYLGVPVALTYTPFRLDNFDIYGRVGGAFDFNIAGRQKLESMGETTTTRFTKSGVQWSVSANVGVMYNLSRNVGVYLEPGVSHYFEFSNQPDSYWKEHPTNFNLKVGVRTTF